MPALSKYSHVTSWKKADKALSKKDSKVIGNNTELVRYSTGNIGVELHDTTVVLFNKNGTIKLSSGGYETSTTKDRINRYTPNSISVKQRDYEWILTVNGKERDFYDGVSV